MKSLAYLSLFLALTSPASSEVVVQDLQCAGDWCAVKRETLLLILSDAERAAHYAQMCGWTKPDEQKKEP